MDEYLEEIRDKPHFRDAVLRSAKPEDVEFVMALLMRGAALGHFTSGLLFGPYEQGQREAFLNLTQGIGTPVQTDRGVERKQTALWIYGSPHLGNIGFIEIAEKHEGSGNQEWEILTAGISEEYRGRGHGRNMLKLFMFNFPPELTLYARCYPASKSMFRLLKSLGFKLLGIIDSGIRELEKRPAKIGLRNQNPKK
ncbi:GNAT family N-acetyltransferase [Microbulbifer taiwanensis]|uniref:GNAT family N-acetyltransferase n=1 Tax=Microbulbifer taiwanensis TaxID=986746 RepID=UPI003621B54B